METHQISSLPIVKQGKLMGILTKKDAVRQGIYIPNLNAKGKLQVGIALGIHDFLPKAKALINA